MSKSELKRMCVQNPIGMAERIVELESRNAQMLEALKEAFPVVKTECYGAAGGEFIEMAHRINAAISSSESSTWLTDKLAAARQAGRDERDEELSKMEPVAWRYEYTSDLNGDKQGYWPVELITHTRFSSTEPADCDVKTPLIPRPLAPTVIGETK